MSPAEALRVIFRHWLIITFGLILTVAATAYGYISIPGSYSSTSVVMLLQRPTAATAGGQNPYLSMDGSLTVTAAAVQLAVSDSPDMAAALAATDSAGTFFITPVMSGPFLQIDSGATSSAAALAIQQVVRDQMQKKLTLLQSSVGAPSNLQIRLNEVTQPTKPVPVLKRKLQFVGGILFGGLAITTSLTFLTDRIRGRRKTDPATHQNLEPPAASVPESLIAPFHGPQSQQHPAEPMNAGRVGRGRVQRLEQSGPTGQSWPDPKLILRANLPQGALGDERGQGRKYEQGPPAIAPQTPPADGHVGPEGRLQRRQQAEPAQPHAEQQVPVRPIGQLRPPVAGYPRPSAGRAPTGQPDRTQNNRAGSWMAVDSPRLIGRDEPFDTAPTESSQIRNGRIGFPATPVSPAGGRSLQNDHSRQRPDDRSVGRRPPPPTYRDRT